MPRRIIYIKNPSSGSNFRTLGGGGGSSPRAPRQSTPRAPSAPTYGTGAVGYAGNYTQGTPSWSQWYNNFPAIQQLPAEIFTGQVPDGFTGAFTIFTEQDLSYLPTYGNRPLTDAERLIGIGYFLLLTGGASAIFSGVEGGAAVVGIAGTQGAGLTNAALLAGGIEVSINDAPIRTRNADGSVSVRYVDLYTYLKYEVMR